MGRSYSRVKRLRIVSGVLGVTGLLVVTFALQLPERDMIGAGLLILGGGALIMLSVVILIASSFLQEP